MYRGWITRLELEKEIENKTNELNALVSLAVRMALHGLDNSAIKRNILKLNAILSILKRKIKV